MYDIQGIAHAAFSSGNLREDQILESNTAAHHSHKERIQ
jgi:hypothetical protein